MADDPFLRPLPPTPCPQPVPFQADKCPDRHVDVIALRPCCSHHRPLDAALLLECPVIHLDAPRELGVLQSLAFAPRQIVPRPVFRVPGWGDNPEDF